MNSQRAKFLVGLLLAFALLAFFFRGIYLLALSEVYGIDRTMAAAAGIAAHAPTTVPVLVFGLAFLGREGLSLGRAVEGARAEQGSRDTRSS